MSVSYLSVTFCAVFFCSPPEREVPRMDYDPREPIVFTLHGVTPMDKGANWRESVAAVREFVTRIDETYYSDEIVYEVDLANELIAELYVDHGHPWLNRVAYDAGALIVIRDVSRLPEEQLPADARRALALGLMKFAEQGGGCCSPDQQAETAATLFALSGDRPAIRDYADTLLADALAWSERVGEGPAGRHIVRSCKNRWGPAFRLVVYDRFRATPLPSELPERFVEARAAIKHLLTQGVSDDAQSKLQRLRSVSKLALQPLENDALTRELQTRLFIAYRSLLELRACTDAEAEFMANTLATVLPKLEFSDETVRTAWCDAAWAVRRDRRTDALVEAVRRVLRVRKYLDAVRQDRLESLLDKEERKGGWWGNVLGTM